MGDCIAYFTALGYTVAIPLTDSQKYDLIVENEGNIYRVQVKTTTQSLNGVPVVQLKTSGGNKTRQSILPFEKTDSDILYVLSEVEGDVIRRHVIPTTDITTLTSINLGYKYEQYRVSN